MNDSLKFSRLSLKETMIDVKKRYPDWKQAWVIKTSFKDVWEFHYKDFYWSGKCDNAYEARESGWIAFLYKTYGVYERKT